jgi:HK97 family phage major capsid protein
MQALVANTEAAMADLVSMRADAAELRQKIDSILSIDGELTTEQVAELEGADKAFRNLQEQVHKAEAVESARESLAAPTFQFRGKQENNSLKQTLDTRQQFIENLRMEIRRPGSAREYRAQTFGTSGANGSAWDLLPVDLQNEMVRLLGNVSAVRNAATVRSFPNDVEIPVVAARASITDFTGETVAYDNFDPSFSKLRFRSFKSAAQTLITEEVLSDSRGGIVDEILAQHAEAHGYFWETKYLGTGATQNDAAPDGILATEGNIANSGVFPDEAVGGTVAIADVEAAGAAIADVTYQNLLSVAFGMPAKYWGLPKSWILSPALYQHILSLTDDSGTVGRPLFLGRASGTIQDTFSLGTLFGYPVYVSDAMTDATPASSFQAVLLEKSSYIVADRQNMRSMIDPYSYGSVGETAYRTMLRSDGRWVRPSSSARLIMAAS